MFASILTGRGGRANYVDAGPARVPELSVSMACGGRQRSRAGRVLWGLALALCVALTQPAMAQDQENQDPAEDASGGSSGPGRVPVQGVPSGLSDALKILQREEPVPATLFDARRQAARAAAIVATFLESEGYYQAEVEDFASGDTTFTRGVRVSAGPLFVYASRRVAWLDAAPDETTQAEIESLLEPISAGAPARAQPVIEMGDALVRRLRAAGYPDASAAPVDALADAGAGSVALEFRLRPGLRASFGDLSVTGLDATDEEFIASLRPWKQGERVTPARMDAFRGRLAETGLFASTAVRLADGASPDANGVAARDVIVELTERERQTIALGGSVSSSEGVGLDAEWELRNFTGWADSLTVSGLLATLERRVKTTYRLPHIGKYGRILELSGEVEDFETDAFDQSGANVSATLAEQISRRVRASIGVEAGYASVLEAAERFVALNRRDLFILSGTGTAEYVGVRDILDPVNGIRGRVMFEPGFTWGDTNIAFARMTAEASAYSDFGTDNLVGAIRGKLGTIAGPSGAPPDRAFFAGGGGSVRGYEYQSLAPRDATGLITGRSLIETSFELRYRASDTLGYVAFIDAGAAGSNVEPPIDDMKFGAGLGLRYYTAFGPLRADFAVPLSNVEGAGDFQIYISIGQAF
jgi:translocation and assembly module TamA